VRLVAADVPITFVAVALIVYVVPVVKPDTVQDAVLVVSSRTGVEHVAAGLNEMEYPVIGDPPLDGGYAHDTTIEVSETYRASRSFGGLGTVGTPTVIGVAVGSLTEGGVTRGLPTVTTTTRKS
jgi:hypothetical protein